jgi:hypothetical protein
MAQRETVTYKGWMSSIELQEDGASVKDWLARTKA